MNALWAFYSAWLCGVASLATGSSLLTAVGGALLLLSAFLVWRRADDPLARKFEGLGKGRVQGRPFLVVVLVLIGACWIVFGLAD